MKITVDFSALWAAARRMGEFDADFEVNSSASSELDIDARLSSTEGLDIALEDLKVDAGVLSVEGRQVLLFIPDHGRNIDEVLAGREEGRKFHVADCRTLESMRQQRRFNRYKATYNISGEFQVYGVSYASGSEREGEVRLKVCRNCLTFLNYNGYANKRGADKEAVYKNFEIAEFLSTYSTLFKSMPDKRMFEDGGGYSEDWKEVSDRYRESVGYRCEECGVDLSANRSLLHTHHISGNKRENDRANLMALCMDCHRKQPKHSYMRVTHDQMVTITHLRKEQGLIGADMGWEDARALADRALEGLLRNYEAKGVAIPEVGYEIAAAGGEIVAELEIAWPARKFGVAITDDDLTAARAQGWQVQSVGDALRSMNQ